MFRMRRTLLALTLGATATASLPAQVQIRVGDPARTLYSELHEALRDGTPAADSVRRILGATDGASLWALLRGAVAGSAPWNDGLLALTRLAELREAAGRDSVAAWRRRLEAGELRPPRPDVDLADLLPGLHAVELELDRAAGGDLPVLAALLPRIPTGDYDLGDAWVFGRLDAGAADTVARRFLETRDRNLRIRYLTLLSFSRDTALVPLLGRIYTAPDSFDLPKRIGIRASDGLLWIGTRPAVEALLAARDAARTRGTYADPRLNHAELDFLGNDSSVVISRTGKWLTEWRGVLP